MLVHFKVLSSSDEGTVVLVEKTVEQPGTFEEIKAKFLVDMPKIFRDGAFNTIEYFIEPAKVAL